MQQFEKAEFEKAEFESCALEPFVEGEEEPDLPMTGDAEVDSKVELNALQEGFIARAKKENARREKATDSEYWICICFQSREQVEEFLANSGLGERTDKYLDGQKVAAKLGVRLTPETVGFGKINIDARFAEMALPLKPSAR